MKAVRADFGPHRGPGRLAWIAFALLVLLVAAEAGRVEWLHARVGTLQSQASALQAQRRIPHPAPSPASEPAYAGSARALLAERDAAWAPTLRSLEGASMIGVTPTRFEFDALAGTARAELEYADAGVLYDYLGRLNDGLPPGSVVGRWVLVETRAQPGGGTPPAPEATARTAATTGAVATIRASWR